MSNELNASVNTVAAYRRDLRQFGEFLGTHDFDALSVTTNDVRAWLGELSARGDTSRTIRRKVQSLRAFYRYLVVIGELKENPAAEVELARLPRHLPQYVRERQMNVLLDSEIDMNDFEQVRDRLVVMMFYETGIRRAELIGLLDVWVDNSKRELRVHGKRDKDRIVPYGAELAEMIDAYRALRDEVVEGGCETFFVTKTGGALYPSLVYNIVHSALNEVCAGGKLSPHVLRHSFASAMLNSGARLDSVKELLGHQSLATTQLYTHITFNELKDSYINAHPRAQLKKGG